jgi:hypothetical protein
LSIFGLHVDFFISLRAFYEYDIIIRSNACNLHVLLTLIGVILLVLTLALRGSGTLMGTALSLLVIENDLALTLTALMLAPVDLLPLQNVDVPNNARAGIAIFTRKDRTLRRKRAGREVWLRSSEGTSAKVGNRAVAASKAEKLLDTHVVQ